MKDERKQCKKHHESTIGKIIYGFLLFLPLFAIGTTCLISTFNMSAKEESEIVYKYETNEVNNANDLIIGNVYNFNLNYNEQFDDFYFYGKVINFKNFYINSVNQHYTDEVVFEDSLDINSTLFIDFSYEDEVSLFRLTFYVPSITDYVSVILDFYEQSNMTINFDFVLDYYTHDNLSYLISCISKCENIPIDYVETHNVETQDVFYNAVDKVEQNPLFNWTTNTGIYNVLNNTCNSLGITTTFIPLLLAYWLIISVMYFLYDIVLIILNILHRKIHELQESI